MRLANSWGWIIIRNGIGHSFIAVHFGVAMLKVAVFNVDFRTICTRDSNATLMLQVHMTFDIYLSEHGDSS